MVTSYALSAAPLRRPSSVQAAARRSSRSAPTRVRDGTAEAGTVARISLTSCGGSGGGSIAQSDRLADQQHREDHAHQRAPTVGRIMWVSPPSWMSRAGREPWSVPGKVAMSPRAWLGRTSMKTQIQCIPTWLSLLEFLRLSLRLLQPVRHSHLAIHRRRDGEMFLRLLALARAPGELAEIKVAVGDEWTPAELGGERHRLTVVGLGRFNLLGRIGRRAYGAENIPHVRFRASLLLSPSEIKGALPTFAGLREPSGRQVGLAERCEAAGTGNKVAD